VKEAVQDESLSDSEILAVLQCCDYNIEQTITALREGSVPSVYSDCVARWCSLKPGFHSNARKALHKEKYASKIKSARNATNARKLCKQKTFKSMQPQVTQLTQAVLAQENATIESILFFMLRTQRKCLRCVRCLLLNGNRA